VSAGSLIPQLETKEDMTGYWKFAGSKSAPTISVDKPREFLINDKPSIIALPVGFLGSLLI